MNSQSKSIDKAHEPPLVSEGGAAYTLPESSDPYLAWMHLMDAVEALCPRWPERAHVIGGTFRL